MARTVQAFLCRKSSIAERSTWLRAAARTEDFHALRAQMLAAASAVYVKSLAWIVLNEY